MNALTVNEIAQAAGGRILSGNPETVVTSLAIDSRVVTKDCLFIPIIGERTDAHQFLPEVCEEAAAVLTSEHDAAPENPGRAAWIRMDDTIAALSAIGALCRSRAMIPAVGVTGSVGKTTTRELIAAALSAGKTVYKTNRNYNSRIGLPITLSEMTNDYDCAVLELGMNVPGELTDIAKLAKPACCVVTNIGVAHMEFYGSQEGICHEKLSVTQGMLPGGVLFANGDDPYLRKFAPDVTFPVVFFGEGEDNDVRAVDVRLEDALARFTAVLGEERVPVSLSVPGRHNVLNALAALAVASHFGVDLHKAAEAIGAYKGYAGRLLTTIVSGVTLIDDAYNASPASMKGGLDILTQRDCAGRRVAVLGDMKELGDRTDDFHREVGAHAAALPLDLLVTIGSSARYIGEAAKAAGAAFDVMDFETAMDARDALLSYAKPGDILYFKASNSMKLGALAAAVKDGLKDA